jgi:peptidoglycan/LPS O-acetylase OafA/YrhL
MEVFLGHLRTLFFKNYWEGLPGTGKDIFYFFTGFGHEAVMVFFVLSGFFITGTIVKSRESGKFVFFDYGLDRLVRLWIVLIPGLALTFIADRIGLHWFGSNPMYKGTLEFMGHIHVADHLNLKTFLGNAFFTQTILVSTFGSNAPLWSLSNEFWYYVLFPVILFVFYNKKLLKKTVFLIAAVLITFFIGKNIMLYFSIWLLGSVLYFLKENLPAPSAIIRNSILVVGLAAFILCFYKLRTGGETDWQKDFMSGIVTGILCYAGLFADIRSKAIHQFSSFFSSISYSLYVIHLPLCILAVSILGGSQGDWTSGSFFTYLFIAVVIFGVVVIFWYFFESRYRQVRTFIKKRFFSRSNLAVITH